MGKVLIRIIGGLVAGAVLSVFGVAFAVWSTARDTENVQSDTIVVLGSAQYNGVPSPIFQWRLQHALDLYRDGYAPVIVTVGGSRSGDEFTEADAGRTWLIEEGGVPAEDVVAVPEGKNTLDSAVALGPVFEERGWDDAIVVTDPPHMLRAKSMIADQGIAVHGSPTRAGPAVQTRETQLRYIIRETGALFYYGLLGGSSDEAGPSVG